MKKFIPLILAAFVFVSGSKINAQNQVLLMLQDTTLGSSTQIGFK